jgi:uncharacterized membrane protein YeaQ/YmgE (transglycosylase-associated protein family)
MGLLAFLAIGLLAGLAARTLPSRSERLVTTLSVGTVSALVGGVIGSLLSQKGGWFGSSPGALVLSAAVAGAVLFVSGFGREPPGPVR